MAKIVIIDDDGAMELLAQALLFRGHEARQIQNASDACSQIQDVITADVVLLDIMMPWPASLAPQESLVASSSGMKILGEIRKRNPKLPVIALSATQDINVIQALQDDHATTFISKWDSHPIKELISRINRILGLEDGGVSRKAFIVHGRSEVLKLQLKNYLQNTLKFSEPIILHEQPSLGRTIIEKFEDYASAAAYIFVLLTPDDVGSIAEEPDDVKRRARQNVIFEMGYFLGMLGRESARVLLLYHGPLELPSDLAGVIYINVEKGIESAGEEIRREVLSSHG